MRRLWGLRALFKCCMKGECQDVNQEGCRTGFCAAAFWYEEYSVTGERLSVRAGTEANHSKGGRASGGREAPCTLTTAAET